MPLDVPSTGSYLIPDTNVLRHLGPRQIGSPVFGVLLSTQRTIVILPSIYGELRGFEQTALLQFAAANPGRVVFAQDLSTAERDAVEALQRLLNRAPGGDTSFADAEIVYRASELNASGANDVLIVSEDGDVRLGRALSTLFNSRARKGTHTLLVGCGPAALPSARPPVLHTARNSPFTSWAQ